MRTYLIAFQRSPEGKTNRGLVYRGKLQAGETLLVHAAAGGVGIAAVQVSCPLSMYSFLLQHFPCADWQGIGCKGDRHCW